MSSAQRINKFWIPRVRKISKSICICISELTCVCRYVCLVKFLLSQVSEGCLFIQMMGGGGGTLMVVCPYCTSGQCFFNFDQFTMFMWPLQYVHECQTHSFYAEGIKI